MAKVFEILEAPKSELDTEEKLRAALKEHRAGFEVENITSDGDNWLVRLAADEPPFKKKDESDDSEDDSDSDEAPSDSSSDSDDDGDDDSEGSEDDSDKDSDKDGDGEKKKDPAAEVKAVIDQLTSLFTDLGGRIDELQAAHDEKADKLKEINKTVGEDGAGPEDVGPVPGGGPAGGPPGAGLGGPGAPAPVPHPGLPSAGPDARKRPMPGAPGGGLPTFTHYEVATHPGVDESGKRISLVAAANDLSKDPEFTGYEVVGMTENADGSYSAKLKRR